jgi:hypothetical protein
MMKDKKYSIIDIEKEGTTHFNNLSRKFYHIHYDEVLLNRQ